MNVHLIDNDNDIDMRINIEDYPINPVTLRFIKTFKTDVEICAELSSMLKHDLDTSIITRIGKLTSIGTYKYNKSLSLYIYYWRKIANPVTSNEYLDKLEKQMIKNIIFDNNYEVPTPVKKERVKRKAANKTPKWIKEETKDMFTGEVIYMYTNTRTGEMIKSDNPNLINEELLKKKTTKKTKLPKQKFSFKLYI